MDRRTIYRHVTAVARRAGVHVHPHALRHTLATQCINRGMSLEAIAALLGHRSPRMTLVYARISDTTVAEQYFTATQAVEADTATARDDGRRHRADDAQLHRRLLGNGHCTRPLELDCRFQTICEGCGFYETGPEFVTILRRQRDDAAAHTDPVRTQPLRRADRRHRRHRRPTTPETGLHDRLRAANRHPEASGCGRSSPTPKASSDPRHRPLDLLR